MKSKPAQTQDSMWFTLNVSVTCKGWLSVVKIQRCVVAGYIPRPALCSPHTHTHVRAHAHTHTLMCLMSSTYFHLGAEQVLHLCLPVDEDAAEGVPLALDLLNLTGQHLQALLHAS